jgi:serine/threonine-protein kinase
MMEAHDKGIILQNMNPDYITVTTDKIVKVIDFGLMESAGLEGISVSSLPADIVAFMSPEQVGARDVDERSNIFSLGVLLYRMLAGMVPFRGDNVDAIIHAIKNSDPDPIRSFSREIPATLHIMVIKMLEKNPARRYQSAEEIMFELRHFKAVSQAWDSASRKKDSWNWVVIAAVIILALITIYHFITGVISNQ